MARLIVQKGKKFIVFVQLKYALPCSQGLPLASLLLSISAGHILGSHNFKIHINTTIPYIHISSLLCLHFKNSGSDFLDLFLIRHTCDNFSPARPPYQQLSVDPLSSLANGFQTFSNKKFLVMSSMGGIVFEVLRFECETVTVCRNNSNHLPSDVALYNRRKVRLFIQL